MQRKFGTNAADPTFTGSAVRLLNVYTVLKYRYRFADMDVF